MADANYRHRNIIKIHEKRMMRQFKMCSRIPMHIKVQNSMVNDAARHQIS